MVRGRVDRTDEPLAKRFSREMKRSMKETGIGNTELARQVGCGQPMMHRYVTGKTIPMLDRAKTLSELLANEKLLTIAQEWAQRTCATCGIKFYTANLQMKAKYCSVNCKSIAFRQQRRDRSAMSAKFALERVKTYQRLVGDFCGDCTAGDGICRDEECILRPVSPLPFIPITGYRHGGLSRRREAS